MKTAFSGYIGERLRKLVSVFTGDMAWIAVIAACVLTTYLSLAARHRANHEQFAELRRAGYSLQLDRHGPAWFYWLYILQLEYATYHIHTLYPPAEEPTRPLTVNEWAMLTCAREIAFSPSSIGDDDMHRLASLTHVNALLLHGNRFSDSDIQHLRALRNLERLFLKDTLVTDAGLRHLESMTQLVSVEITGSRCTSCGIQQLRQALHNTTVTWQPPSQCGPVQPTN